MDQAISDDSTCFSTVSITITFEPSAAKRSRTAILENVQSKQNTKRITKIEKIYSSSGRTTNERQRNPSS